MPKYHLALAKYLLMRCGIFFVKKKKDLGLACCVPGSKSNYWVICRQSFCCNIQEVFPKIRAFRCLFYTDDRVSYSKVIPRDRHIIGKKHTVGIEQNNSNIRHFLGRFTRRSKFISHSKEMVLATLKICWYINENDGFEKYQNIFIATYG